MSELTSTWVNVRHDVNREDFLNSFAWAAWANWKDAKLPNNRKEGKAILREFLRQFGSNDQGILLEPSDAHWEEAKTRLHELYPEFRVDKDQA